MKIMGLFSKESAGEGKKIQTKEAPKANSRGKQLPALDLKE